MRTRRRGVSSRLAKANAKALAKRLLRWPQLRARKHFACYLKNDGEIDPAPLIQALWALGKKVYLPVVIGSDMRFAPYGPATKLTRNRFGIPEPAQQRSKPTPLRTLDIVLVPLVAFDHRGNRIGMGGGFYDRCFAKQSVRSASGLSVWRKPKLIGIAYEFQCLPSLPVESWDVPLRAIATESRLVVVRQAR